MSEEKLMVAKTILAQLGGNRFVTMTGAKNFVGSDYSLSFQLPGKPGYAKDGINAVTITLTPLDEYDMEFLRVRGGERKVVKKYDGIYCDQLRQLFTEATGLYTSL